jgi:small subunit ribosomal protein S20
LAHSKSAIKRWRQSLARRDRNRSVKSQTRTLLNRAVVAIESDPSTAEAAVREAVSALDRAAQKNVIHDNAAARGKARLLKRYNLATATAVAAAASAPAEEATEEKKPARRGRAAAADKPATTRSRAKKDDEAKPAKPAARRSRKS